MVDRPVVDRMVLGGPQILDCIGAPRLPPLAVGGEGGRGGGQPERRGCGSRIEHDVAGQRRAGRAARSAADPRRRDSRYEPSVEAGVFGLHCPVAALKVLVHSFQSTTWHRGRLAELRHHSEGAGR